MIPWPSRCQPPSSQHSHPGRILGLSTLADFSHVCPIFGHLCVRWAVSPTFLSTWCTHPLLYLSFLFSHTASPAEDVLACTISQVQALSVLRNLLYQWTVSSLFPIYQSLNSFLWYLSFCIILYTNLIHVHSISFALVHGLVPYPSRDCLHFLNEWLNVPLFSGVLFNSLFFFPSKIAISSSKNLKLSSETETQKGLFSDEEDSDVRNFFS